ncbi:hypothetical protein ACFX13_011571 [Malus domestica]
MLSSILIESSTFSATKQFSNRLKQEASDRTGQIRTWKQPKKNNSGRKLQQKDKIMKMTNRGLKISDVTNKTKVKNHLVRRRSGSGNFLFGKNAGKCEKIRRENLKRESKCSE